MTNCILFGVVTLRSETIKLNAGNKASMDSATMDINVATNTVNSLADIVGEPYWYYSV